MVTRVILSVVLFSLLSFNLYAAERVVVFAASSTTNVLNDVVSIYNSKGGDVLVSFAGSGPLAKQIEAGAPAAIFLSANQEWMDYLDKESLLEPGSRVDLLGNEIVLIGDKNNKTDIVLNEKTDIVALLKGGKLVIGSPESVPAGAYAKKAFIYLKLWDKLQKNVAMVENVRVALAFVSRGEAPYGVVFSTDAMADKNVRIVAYFPADSYGEVAYPAAMIKGKATGEVKKFYQFLQSDEAKAVYKKYGFKVIG